MIAKSCISFDSYIKPQLYGDRGQRSKSCISFDSYIKPQPISLHVLEYRVVYLLIPTSNHNLCVVFVFVLLVVYLLIPTSNHNLSECNVYLPTLYIF